MTTSISPRLVTLTARAASDLKDRALIGTNTPYLEITLGETTLKTRPDKKSPDNPVFDENFEVKIPGETPGSPLTLRVTAKNAAKLVPDQIIGSGSVQLGKLMVEGHEELRVPLSDNAGHPAGVAFIAVKLVPPEEEQEIPSAAGTVLGEVHRGPKGAAIHPAGPDIVPTTTVGPSTPTTGAVVPGNVDDPSSPAYGILQD